MGRYSGIITEYGRLPTMSVFASRRFLKKKRNTINSGEAIS